MVAEKMEKDESSRTLLDKLEGEWDSPSGPSPEMQAALDAAAERLVDSLNPPPVSVPTMAELDSGWGEEDDDDEDDDGEPELPDEPLEARRQKRRVKAETKKARRKARLDAQRAKQKGKQRKARPAQSPSRSPKRSDAGTGADDRDGDEGARSRPMSTASKPMLSKTNQWMLAVAIIIFLAAAIFAAVVAR
jgi:hypothetical protein